MIDQMLNVPGVPWKDLGTLFKDYVSSSREMIEKAKLNYSCSAHVMYTDVSQRVGGYHAIYRDDCMNVLGVVNNRYPSIVQNEDSFLVMEPMIQSINCNFYRFKNLIRYVLVCFRVGKHWHTKFQYAR